MKRTELFIKQICRQIETAVNRNIKSFPDAIWLSDTFKAKKISVSSSTIARLYGISAYSSKPFLSTLNQLAKFLEYDNWENYLEDQSKYHFSSNIFLNEDPEGFSQSVLEMALYLKRYSVVEKILEHYSYYENNLVHFSTANLIGKYVKKNNYDEELLLILAQSKAGKSLFYGCFVDEDNENNYFSKAIYNYYLPQVSDFDNTFFVTSYIVSQNIYSGKPDDKFVKQFLELTKKTIVDDLHYHLLSRYFECNILIDGIKSQLQYNVNDYLNSITYYAYIREKNEWLLARSIRSLLHFGFKKELINHSEFNEIVNTTIMKKRKTKNSAALYIIQLYWLWNNLDDRFTYQPFHLSLDYLQGNSKEKLAIECATASLYAKGKTKKITEENIKQYCDDVNIKWIPNLLFN
jgi:hypothetical protein